jgi:hypothetical protein
MRSHRMRAIRRPIEFAGYIALTEPGSTSAWTISLTSTLTGGVDTVVRARDLVVVVVGASNSATASFTDGSGTWTRVANLYANNTGSTADACFAVFVKIMAATPDTSITVNISTAVFAQGLVYVLRNVNATTPEDVTATTATTTSNGTVPDPPAITPTTIGSAVVACVCGAGAGAVTALTSSDLANFISHGSGFAQVAVGVVFGWGSGAVDPAALGGGGASLRATASVTMAMRPA